MSTSTTSEKNNVVSFGFVDTHELGHFTGWCYTNSHEDQHVILKVNNQTIRPVRANVTRPDVKQIGVPNAQCGFDLNICSFELSPTGCIISFHDPVFGNLLENGKFYCHSGSVSKYSDSDHVDDMLSIKSYVKIFQTTESAMSTESFLNFALKKLRPTSPQTFVAMSYLLILGRTPDPEGFSSSLKSNLISDASRYDFLLSMINSVEFEKKRSIASATVDLGKLPSH